MYRQGVCIFDGVAQRVFRTNKPFKRGKGINFLPNCYKKVLSLSVELYSKVSPITFSDFSLPHNRMKNIFWIILAAFALNSCSPYHKLLKSNDVPKKYDESIRLFETGKYAKAFTMMDNVLPSVIGSTKEDTLTFLMGKSAYKLNDFASSAQMMDQYRNKFTRSPYTPEAEYLYGMSFYEMSLPSSKDQSDTKRALIAFNEFLTRYPEDSNVVHIQQKIEELTRKLYTKVFDNAALYYKLGLYQSAVTALRAALKENPEIPYREEMMYLICKSWFSYAQNSIYSRQLDRYLKMIDSYYNFKTSYPETSEKYSRDLERMLDISQEFTEKNGVLSQAIETSSGKITKAKTKIQDNKDKIFLAKTKAERKSLQQEIKDLNAELKVLRKQLAVEQKSAAESKRKDRQAKKQAAKQKDKQQSIIDKKDNETKTK